MKWRNAAGWRVIWTGNLSTYLLLLKTLSAATSLLKLGANEAITPEIFLDALRPAFVLRCRQAAEDFNSLLTDWERHAEGLGKQVTVGKADDAQMGIFKGLGPDGALLLEMPDGATQTIRAGDVELVKEIDGDAARN